SLLFEQLAESPRDFLRRACLLRLPEQRAQGPCGLPGWKRIECLENLDHGQVRDPVAVGEAAAAHHLRLDLDDELCYEPRFADARGAENREELARTIVHSLGEDVL